MRAIQTLKKKRYLIVLVFLLAGLSSYSQNLKPLQKKVKELLAIDAYTDALPLLLKLDSIRPLDGEINYLAGICYLQLDNKKEALKFLQRAEALNYDYAPIYFNIGKLFHSMHEFDRAKRYFEKFKSVFIPANVNDSKKVLEVDRYIANCTNGVALKSKPINTTIYNLGPAINSSYPEYVPLIPADERFLIFSSKRAKGNGNANLLDEDIFISYKDSNGLWAPAIKLPGSINTNGHEASIALSSSGQKLYVYKDQGNGDIFVSQLSESKWQTPIKLSASINSPSWEPSASVTPEENVIYFSSNRPGGHGGTDLYLSRKKEDGTWGEAINLGKEINTMSNEDSPFIHPDGKTLFFSSEGHNSMGGHDIFKTTFDTITKKWLIPENIGFPINTAGDDDFFVWSADGKRAYFSSIREGGYGDKDIYMAEMPVATDNLVLLKGSLYAEGLLKSEKVLITVTDINRGKVLSRLNFDHISGSYSVILNAGGNYSIQVEAKGFLPYSQNIEVSIDSAYKEIIRDIRLEPLKEGSKAILRNVFFDSGKATIQNKSTYELDNLSKILIDNPTIYVEIAGHTDNVGDAGENQKLSFERAKAVKDYLVKRGLDPSRLVEIGYGEQFPIQANETESERQANRRTEFIIINKDSLRKYKGHYFHK
ncbi:MAG TPA: OmpA family protein [Cytophagaceae bacterium]|jgi:outer membrane protein OmpA-like peptidoglycan-associated protein/Tol biopolymer transport system component